MPFVAPEGSEMSQRGADTALLHLDAAAVRLLASPGLTAAPYGSLSRIMEGFEWCKNCIHALIYISGGFIKKLLPFFILFHYSSNKYRRNLSVCCPSHLPERYNTAHTAPCLHLIYPSDRPLPRSDSPPPPESDRSTQARVCIPDRAPPARCFATLVIFALDGPHTAARIGSMRVAAYSVASLTGSEQDGVVHLECRQAMKWRRHCRRGDRPGSSTSSFKG